MMKLRKFFVLLMFIASYPVLAYEYQIDPSHSFVNFEISHLGIGKVVGRFNNISGDLNYDSENPAMSSVNATISTSSVDTGNVDRDKHLRSKDFFNVDMFKTATFVSNSFMPNKEGGTLNGKLTILNKEIDVSMPITKIGEGIDPWGFSRIGFQTKVTLNRTDFGINYQLGENTDLVTIDIFIEATRTP